MAQAVGAVLHGAVIRAATWLAGLLTAWGGLSCNAQRPPATVQALVCAHPAPARGWCSQSTGARAGDLPRTVQAAVRVFQREEGVRGLLRGAAV